MRVCATIVTRTNYAKSPTWLFRFGERSMNRKYGLYSQRPRENPTQNARTLRDTIPRDLRCAWIVHRKTPQLRSRVSARPYSSRNESECFAGSPRPLDSRKSIDSYIRPRDISEALPSHPSAKEPRTFYVQAIFNKLRDCGWIVTRRHY